MNWELTRHCPNAAIGMLQNLGTQAMFCALLFCGFCGLSVRVFLVVLFGFFWFGWLFFACLFFWREDWILCKWINLITWEIKCWILILLMLVCVWRDLLALEHKLLRNKSRPFPLLGAIALYSYAGRWELRVIDPHLKTMNPKSTKQIKLTGFVSCSWFYKQNLSNLLGMIILFWHHRLHSLVTWVAQSDPLRVKGFGDDLVDFCLIC